MKFFETHFEEYILSSQKINLHPKLNKIFSKFPSKFNEIQNIIFFGPSGVGKYTQVLKLIKKYSPSELKYEKKISVTFNKPQFFFKISDIHYEIDMSLLGCNSKLLWHEIYLQIIDIISTKNDKYGIILCKNFHEIHGELLDNLYSYMQQNNSLFIDLKFFFITEHIGFIPDNIINCCQIINVSRPSKISYKKIVNNDIHKPNMNITLDKIINIKNLYNSIHDLSEPHKIICDKILKSIDSNINDLKFLKFRDLLYDIFIYNLDIHECIWYIITTLMNQNKIPKNNFSTVLIQSFIFFHYYNNNYRPIYHLEKFMFFIASTIHNFT
jgi:hypothetical protein